jgi:beta-mannosidase
VKALASIDGDGKADRVHFEVFLEAERVSSADADIAANHSTAEFHIQKPNLWYPIRYGKQPLYTVIATLFAGNDKLDTITKRIGLRRAELVQHALQDQPGTSFFFKINNIPIFCGGSNWIPADSFVPRITAQKYRDWIQMVADGNQCMIRVWGGGIYEEQVFYDTCDELGILVWQDFLFGCGNYGVWDDFVANVQKEAEENIKRLRHHPCMVIWAGNNEDYQVQESMGLHYDFSDKNVDNWLKSDFPARYIYEKVLADACKKLIPKTYYHYGSPWGAGKDTKDPTVGDIHQWNVWHGTQERYQDFDKLAGRFVSEFGMEAFPDIKTIDGYLPEGKDDPDRYAQSSTVDFHNKAAGHERRLALYLAENIRYSSEPLEAYVYFTQLMQAECLSFAYRLFKRQWKGPEREYCAGVLVWQINDCWPVTSWAICDYYLQPKLAYYAVKRELAPFTVGIKRVEGTDGTRVEVWACNLTTEETTVECRIQAWNLENGEQIAERVTRQVVLKANRTTEICESDPWGAAEAKGKGLEGKTMVQAALYRGHELLARFVDWPQPLKYCHFPKADVKVTMVDDYTVEVSSDSAIKGLVLTGEGVVFEDNCMDLAPGEAVKLRVLRGGKKGMNLTYSHLGNMVV